jgi:TIR domain
VLYDVFICHASEDKDAFVRPLAEELVKNHVEVWYDEFSLTVGDSLRELIDKGLSQSRYGVVVLSPHFFLKRWPKRELNGLVAREMSEGNTVILPVWHEVTGDDVVRYSPPLADLKGVDSRKGVSYVCRELLKRLRPQQSPLIVARDEILAHGLRPPVVTDEWWLDIVAASSRLDGWGASIPDDSVWGRWAFPLPETKDGVEAKGMRLAWTALQLNWVKAAEEQKITQITRPDLVHRFIASQPGLRETCLDFPLWLASYAPQLTVRGLGGEYEQHFDGIIAGEPDCEELALRAPNLDQHDAAIVACHYVQGTLFGPKPQFYRQFDYIVWFLSTDSEWLPRPVRALLQRGMCEWSTWPTSGLDSIDQRPFLRELWQGSQRGAFKFTPEAKEDLLELFRDSIGTLGLLDDPRDILKLFLSLGYIDHYIQKRESGVGRRKRVRKRRPPANDRNSGDT